MYVYYFERICRRVLGDESFTLPYWNYSSGSTVLPARFRDPSSPLFRAARNPGPNRGDPLLNPGEPANTFSAGDALARPVYNRIGVAAGFNDLLDRRPHGLVHTTIGTDRGMGAVPWAAQDPIFWLHHCNIDRIWATWNNAGRTNPTDSAWLNRGFTFADENSRAVTAFVRDFSATLALGYGYDRFEPMPAATSSEASEDDPLIPSARRAAMNTQTHKAAPSGGIALGAQTIKVTLRPTARTSGESEGEDGHAKRLYLVLRNYRANTQPGIIYHVYLALPAGVSGHAAEQHYVGPMSFFDAVPHGHHGVGAGRTTSFDVTDVAERLRAAGLLTGHPSVTIAPAGEPATASQPIIGEISLVEQ
jgi:tyrosinase